MTLASFTAAYDQDRVYSAVTGRDPQAVVIAPPRLTAVLSGAAQTEPTQRDCHLQSIAQSIAEKGRMNWRKASGDNKRARVESAIGRYTQVIGDGLRFRKNERRATEVGVAIHVLNRMLALGRPNSVRVI